MCKLLGVIVLIFALSSLPSSHGEAQLLVSKTILNEYAVEGRELTVKYSIYNVGSSPATSVTLEDNTFLPDEFTPVQGLLTVSWDKLLHNNNISHVVILKPNMAGRFNISWATVSYSWQHQEEGKQSQVAYSSAPGVMYVMPYADFSRKHDNHLMDWLAFVAMSAPTVLLPLFLWYRSYSKYETLKMKKA